MPQRPGETEQEWMDRIRRARDPDTMMLRTRAAICLVNASNSEASKMNAFLAIFHPDLPAEQHLALVQDARRI